MGFAGNGGAVPAPDGDCAWRGKGLVGGFTGSLCCCWGEVDVGGGEMGGAGSQGGSGLTRRSVLLGKGLPGAGGCRDGDDGDAFWLFCRREQTPCRRALIGWNRPTVCLRRGTFRLLVRSARSCGRRIFATRRQPCVCAGAEVWRHGVSHISENQGKSPGQIAISCRWTWLDSCRCCRYHLH